MSVVTSIRDYIEILNTQIGAREEPISLFLIISETWPHILQICKDAIWYVASLHFLRDNLYQPYLGGIDNGFIKVFFSSVLLPHISDKKLEFFLYGFGNSFFISLPGSIGTLIVLRRIILQGIPAGVAATIGGVLGSCFTMAFVIFGSNVFTYGSTFLDLIFLLGLLIPGYVIFQGLCFSDVRLISVKDKISLLSIGFIHFILGLCNQSTLFKHLREVTIFPYPTRFLGIANNSSGIFYVFGFSIGNIFFAFSAFFSVVFLINWWLARSTVHRSRLMKFSENTSVVFLTALSISTISYYGTDFLLTKSFGFLPNDKGLAQTILAPSSLFKDPHNLTGVHALYPSNEFSLDPAPFDRPLEKLFRRSILYKQPYFKYRSFEELNYQGEKHWLHRGFRHGSAKPIKTVTLPSEKKNLAKGRALLKSLDKAVGWVDENQNLQTTPQFAFTNLAKEEIDFDFLHLSALSQNDRSRNSTFSKRANNSLETTQGKESSGSSVLVPKASPYYVRGEDFGSTTSLRGAADLRSPTDMASTKEGDRFFTETPNNFDFLEQKFKRFFYGQIGLLPGRLPPPSGPFDSQEMAHKRLAFTNPVYKALLSFDIDLFLKRQPPTHSLSADDEHNIFLKRQILERYINTQRDYFANNQTIEQNVFVGHAVQSNQGRGGFTSHTTQKAGKDSHGKGVRRTIGEPDGHATSLQSINKNNPLTVKSFHHTFPENLQQQENFIKSFANQTYKHQFKGTLEIVRQLFAVSLDCPEPSSVAGGGTWDKLIKGGHNFFEDDKGLAMPRPINPRILKFDQPLYVTSNTPNLLKLKQSKHSSIKDRGSLSFAGAYLPKDREEDKVGAMLVAPRAKLEQHERGTKAEDIVNVSGPFVTKVQNLSESDPRFHHEELSSLSLLKIDQQKQNSFLELSDSSPFYVGWDGERRQLLLTQRYLPRKNALIYNTQDFEKLSFENKHSEFSDIKTQPAIFKDKSEKQKQKEFTFTTWPLLKSDPTERSPLNWRIPSRSLEHLLALEEEARMGLDEPSDKTKGIRGSYERFTELWNTSFSHSLPKQTPPFKINRWPTNITTPSVQTDLDTFDQVETALFTGVKRGGFIWPGGREFKFLKN